MEYINNILNNIVINIIENITYIELIFQLDESFDLNNFSRSIEIFNKKYNLPIKLIKKYEEFIIYNFEIYICISDKLMSVNCSHKYYDATSIYKIFNLIDNEYKNIITHDTIYLDNVNIFIENKLYSSLLNNLSRKKLNIDFTHFRIFDAQSNQSNPFISAHEGGILNENWCKIDEELILLKNIKNNKSVEIINEIQELFKPLDILLVIDKRKNLNINENVVGCYTDLFYVKNDEKDFINKLKKYEKTIKQTIDNKFIVINSYLKFKIPSFCIHQLPMQLDISKYLYYIFITPKNKEGFSSIFMNKKLYNFLQKSGAK
jgi:hypothetical protein